MAIKAGMTVAEAILQLTRGFVKVMGRKPDGLEKIKIQQEAVERLKNLEKVVDMQGNVIDTSKGIMGGRQIQDNKEFGEALKKALMEKDNPYSDLVKTTQKGPKTLEQRRKEAEEALKNKNVKPIRESLEDFVDDAGGVNPDDPRGIDDFIPDPDKKVITKGLSDKDFRSEKTSFRLNIAKNSPDFNQDLADRIIKREIYTDLSNSQRKQFLDDLDFVLKNPRDGNAQGGRAGFASGKVVLEGLAKLFKKKTKPKGDKIYGVGGEEIDVADLKKSLGLDEATQKKDMENLEKKLQMIIGRDRTKHATGGRAGFAMGLGPRFIKFLNETNPIEAYKKYLQSVKKRAQEGDVKSLAPELGAVGATGILVNRRMKDVLENMKNQDMENNLENFKKELDADPFYKEYPEIKDKVLENYTETMFGEKKAQGGRAGFANGSEDSGAPSIKLDAEGSRSGRQQIKGAPEGITSDEETFNAILKADIPISEKIDVLSKLQYGKSRNRIEAGGQEIFLDEGGFKSRDIGLGFNKESLLEGSDSEGIGGTLMYNLETGEPEFTVGYKKKFNFAGGGRANFDEGGMSRRKFMKIMGGIATLPILGKYIKPAMPLIKKGAEITGPALDKIVETVMSAGKLISQSGKRLKELTTKKKLKDVEVEEDMMDGPSYTIKTKDKTIYYKPGKQDEMGVSDDIIEVIEDKITKKAGGGIARMLGE